MIKMTHTKDNWLEYHLQGTTPKIENFIRVEVTRWMSSSPLVSCKYIKPVTFSVKGKT